MEGDDSDQFASADEGIEQIKLDTKSKNLTNTTFDEKVADSSNVDHELEVNVQGNVDPHDQNKSNAGNERKKKKKKRKQRSRPVQECEKTAERHPDCQSSGSGAIIQPDPMPSSSNEAITCITSLDESRTSSEAGNIKSEDITEEDVDCKHAANTILEPAIPPVQQVSQSHEANHAGIWDPDALSSAATSLIRNVGGGISSLAGVLGQVLSTTEPDEDAAERRRRRKAEEEKDLRTTMGAWSDVWNAAWGDDSEEAERDRGDGWELDDPAWSVEQPETHEKGGEKEKDSLPKRDSINGSPAGKSVESWSWAGVSSFAHNLTTSFQEKSRNLVQGGVDVLEIIGRKTMSVLEENDPGFRYTKKLIRPHAQRDQPSLSQVIHEAREQSKARERIGGADESRASQNRGDFNYQLEASRGLVHLEALELVSYQAESRLHTCLTTASSVDDGTLETIWETLNFEDDEQTQKGSESDDFLNDAAKRLLPEDIDPDGEESCDLPIPKEDVQLWIVFQKVLAQLNTVYSGQKLSNILATCLRNALSPKDEDPTTQEYFFTAISTLAEMTSGNLEYLHKFTECLLIHTHEPDTDFVRIAKLIRLFLLVDMKLKTKACTELIGMVKKARNPPPSEEPTGKLVSTNHLIASILLECGNAQSHLKNAARLLIPVLQLAYLTTTVGVDKSE